MHKLTITMLALLAVLHAGRAHAVGLFLPDKGRSIQLVEVRVFLVWDADKKTQTLTLEPLVTGNAQRYAWVLATPNKPKLDEMPRNTFDLLGAFTLLEPMDPRFAGKPEPPSMRFAPDPTFRISEGIIGPSDYWIFEPGQAKRLRDWGEKHGYDAARIEELLMPLLKKDWFLTVLEGDAASYKRDKEGVFHRALFFSPIRLSYPADEPHLPLTLTQHSIKEPMRLLLYAAGPSKLDLPGTLSYQPAWLEKWTRALAPAPTKLDLPGALSYQPAWLEKWTRALRSVEPAKRTAAEKDWLTLADGESKDRHKALQALEKDKRIPTRLDYGERLTEEDMNVLTKKAPFTREAPPDIVEYLVHLVGHLKAGHFVTKMETILRAHEPATTLTLVPAQVGGKKDEISRATLLLAGAP